MRYDIKGVGNLLTMTCKKNLPLLSSDYVYSGENRYFLLEIYDLSVRHDELFDKGIEYFAKLWERRTRRPWQPAGLFCMRFFLHLASQRTVRHVHPLRQFREGQVLQVIPDDGQGLG